MSRYLPTACGICGDTVTVNDKWVVGHTLPRATHPELTHVVSNWRIEHDACSRRSGPMLQATLNKARALVEAEAADQEGPEAGFLGAADALERRGPPCASPSPTPGGIEWETLTNVPHLAEFQAVPTDASVPFVMSPPHPRAVGTYGPAAEAFLAETLRVKLRWWQRLALYRMLEHDSDGKLCWRQVLISTPRRAGKSVLLRAIAWWRIHQADLFGEPQLAVHTGSDLPVCLEIIRKTFSVAENRGYTVRRKNGQEAVEIPVTDSRWIVRSQSALYGYDTTLGLIDEAWAVPAHVADDGMEPALLEREQPQLLLVSTAHRKSTSLMTRRFDAAMSGMGSDEKTLVLWWSAPDGDPGDPATWQKASPHWTPEREEFLRDTWERALRGEVTEKTLDADPIESFLSQYLNRWPTHREIARGEPLIDRQSWEDAVSAPVGPPAAAAIEAWWDSGAVLVTAFHGDSGVVLSARSFQTVAEAVAAAPAEVPLGIGASLMRHAEGSLYAEPMSGTTRVLALELAQALSEGTVRHDGGDLLTQQVLALRVNRTPEGPRLLAISDRADAVKAAAWALRLAMSSVIEQPAIF